MNLYVRGLLYGDPTEGDVVLQLEPGDARWLGGYLWAISEERDGRLAGLIRLLDAAEPYRGSEPA